MSSKEERLREIIDMAYSGNQRKFAMSMKIDASVVSRVLSGKYPLPKRCDDLLRKDGVNPDYYRNGNGQLIINSTVIMEKSSQYSVNKPDNDNMQIDVITSLQNHIDSLLKVCDDLRRNNEHLIEQNNKLVTAVIGQK